MISFLYPKFLLFLFLIPIVIIIYFLSFSYRKKRALMFPNFEALERVFGVEVFSRNSVNLVMSIAILLLMILALSGTRVSSQTNNPFSYVIAVDNSGSMKAMDIAPSRLDAAKNAAKRFVDILPSGVEIGVLEFSGNVQIIQKPDTSKLRIDAAIDSILVGDIEGTDIYTAIADSNSLLGNRKNKAVILISDGQLNFGSLDQIVQYAVKNDLTINAVAIGTTAGGLSEAETISEVDENALQEMAFATNGKFFRVEDLDSLDKSFDSIASVKKIVYTDISTYLAILAIILFSLNWILYNFRFKTLP